MRAIPVNKFYRLINHGPCVLVSAGNGTVNNVAPAAWVTPVNDEPPLVGVCLADTHYMTALIRRYRCFTVNIPPATMRRALVKAGSMSGRKIDKFAACGFTALPGVQVPAVHIGGCVGFIEALVHRAVALSGVTLFIGKVVHCAVARHLFHDGRLLTGRARTLHHVGGNRFFCSTRAK